MRPRSGASAARSSTATGTTATAETGERPRYRGRFAPSPTGRLHLGSLLAAVGSYLDAKAHGGEWLVRLEDLDRTREVGGAADAIVATLEAFGLQWDGEVLRQSAREAAYATALEQLAALGLTYPCSCTRAEIGARTRTRPAIDPDDSPESETRYPGTCRLGATNPLAATAIRFRTLGYATVTVADRLQPPLTQDLERTVGDFVLRRRDGYFAYQLAVVVDDAFQGVTDVVRGLDLYANTPRQILLQQALGIARPRYLHLPLVVDATGGKLSKSRRALPADPASAPRVLTGVLGLLGHRPPAVLHCAPVAEQLAWAVSCWNPSFLQGVTTVSSTD